MRSWVLGIAGGRTCQAKGRCKCPKVVCFEISLVWEYFCFSTNLAPRIKGLGPPSLPSSEMSNHLFWLLYILSSLPVLFLSRVYNLHRWVRSLISQRHHSDHESSVIPDDLMAESQISHHKDFRQCSLIHLFLLMLPLPPLQAQTGPLTFFKISGTHPLLSFLMLFALPRMAITSLPPTSN